MSWTPNDATRHTKLANTPAKRKRWALVANAALKRCERLDQGDCEGRAIRQANAVIAGTATSTKKVSDGIYLVSPHGRLIWEGRKTIIVKSKQYDLQGTWLVISKENTKGLAFGVAEVGPVASVQTSEFDALFKQHRVTRKEREKWWADSTKLYLYPIKSFDAFDKPAMVTVPPGVQTIMRNVQFIDKKPDIEPGQDRERPQTEEGRPRKVDDAENPEVEQKATSESEEVNMPYTSMEDVNPAIRGIKPPVTLAQANLIAKWADAMEEEADDGARSPWAVAIAQFKRLYQVQAGKWVKKKKSEKGFVTLQELLEERSLDEIAVKARGAGQGVGGEPQGDQGAETCVCPECGHELPHKRGVPCAEVECPKCGAAMQGKSTGEIKESEESEPEPEFKGIWSTAQVNDFPDSSFLLVESGKKDSEGKTVPRTLRHLPYKDAGGKVDLPHVRNAISRAPRIKLKDGSRISPAKATALQDKARAILAKTKPGKKELDPVDDKGGRRLQSSKLEFLGSLKAKFESLLKDLGELIGWASYDDRKPAALGALFKEGSGFKALQALDGSTWLFTWTMNAFEDREQEIFTTKSIEDYVARHADDAAKGKYDFWHLPGTEFGTIMWQGTVGRFLVEAGIFDDTEIGQKAEEFFLAHPDGHPEFAPEGWGTSHKYKYREGDRKDGIYDWFEKQLTTVLPLSAAANLYNPRLEVKTVDEKQYKALVGIWGEEIATQVVALGEQRTKELEEAGVAFKSAEGTKAEDFAAQLHAVAETVTDEALKEKLESIAAEVEKISESKAKKSEDGEGDEKAQDGKELARTVAEELQLGELSVTFKALGEVVGILVEQSKALNTRLETLEQDDEIKLAGKAKQLPRFSWFRASDAAETVLNKDDALKSAKPKSPSAVRNIAGKVVGGN